MISKQFTTIKDLSFHNHCFGKKLACSSALCCVRGVQALLRAMRGQMLGLKGVRQ